LQELEAVVVGVEQAASREAATDQLRADIELPGALRWIRRRLQAVYAVLVLLLGLFPDLFAGCQITVGAFRQRLGVDFVLPRLREITAVQLGALPPPLGFRPPRTRGGERTEPNQHQAGPDPPAPIT
jgi:hypothetical protein